MDNTVFDILIYVFDRYMLEELPATAERETLARDLESAGFGEANVERALDWLADLADERERPDLRGHGAFRVYAPEACWPRSRRAAFFHPASARSSSIACWRSIRRSWIWSR